MGLSKKYVVIITAGEQSELDKIINQGNALASVRKRAIALKYLSKCLTDKEISVKSGLSVSAINRLGKRFYKDGFDLALYGAEKRRRASPYTPEDEAELVALACSDPPEGRKCWTCELLAEAVSERIGKSMKKTKVHLLLKKKGVSLGNTKCGASGK